MFKPRRRFEAGGYATGMQRPGNIDLHNRPKVANPDGSYSTVRSMTIGGDDEPVYLVPTVVGRRVVSDQEAKDYFRKTGEHLGKFNTIENADRYAEGLHEDQAREYEGKARGGLVGKVTASAHRAAFAAKRKK